LICFLTNGLSRATSSSLADALDVAAHVLVVDQGQHVQALEDPAGVVTDGRVEAEEVSPRPRGGLVAAIDGMRFVVWQRLVFGYPARTDGLVDRNAYVFELTDFAGGGRAGRLDHP